MRPSSKVGPTSCAGPGETAGFGTCDSTPFEIKRLMTYNTRNWLFTLRTLSNIGLKYSSTDNTFPATF